MTTQAGGDEALEDFWASFDSHCKDLQLLAAAVGFQEVGRPLRNVLETLRAMLGLLQLL